MTRPTARVLALLEILQTGGTRTVSDLAQRLGVDERTVRRYIEHLIDLDVPVQSVRGRYGGYRLSSGYRLPPLMFTDDEALGVLLGLLAGRRDGLVPSSVAAMESAAAKIRRVLPLELGRRLEALLESSSFEPAAVGAAAPESRILLDVAAAARNRHPIRVSYTARDGRQSERTLEPYGIVVNSGHWYVTGADSASGEVRTFRLDRIARVTELSGSFEAPADFEPAEHVLSSLVETPYQHQVSVRIEGAAKEVRARFPAGIAAVEPVPDQPGWVRLRMRAERLDWVAGLLAVLDRPFVIESPEQLRIEIDALAGRLVSRAGATEDQ